ncbi:unnamed protein product [Rhodiola kirilowii]
MIDSSTLSLSLVDLIRLLLRHYANNGRERIDPLSLEEPPAEI